MTFLQINYITRSRFLTLLIACYAIIYILANWFDCRLIKFLGLTTGSGALIFPFTYLLSDIITEVYGYKNARLAIFFSLMFNACFVIYGQIIASLLSYANLTNDSLSLFLSFNLRVFLISVLSFLLTEQLNSYFVAKLKILFSGALVGFRFILSTLSAQLINTLIFCIGVFYGSMSNKNLLFFMAHSWVIMVSIELLAVPVAVRLSKKLKIIENLDIYDQNTYFRLLQINNNYLVSDNNFLRGKSATTPTYSPNPSEANSGIT